MTPSPTLTSLTAHTGPTNDAAPPTVLHCHSTADFLAAMPFFTGFTAENSLFIVVFTGARAGCSMRVDLPEQETGPDAAALLDAVCELIDGTGDGPGRPAVVITTERTFAESGGAPWRRFAGELRRRFKRRGWPLRELAVIAPDGWAGLLDARTPRRGRPLAEIGASPVVAAASDAVGARPLPLEDAGALPSPDPQREAAVVARLAELDRREAERHPTEETTTGPPAWLHGVARVAGACFDQSRGELPEPRLCARLIRAAELPESWLVVLLTAVTRPEFVIEVAGKIDESRFIRTPVDIDAPGPSDTDAPGAEPLASAGWSIRRLLASLSQTRPDSAKLSRAVEVLSEIAAHAPRSRRPGVLAMLAWAWWMTGLQSVAGRIVVDARAIDDRNELVLMVERLVDAPAEWTARPRREASE